MVPLQLLFIFTGLGGLEGLTFANVNRSLFAARLASTLPVGHSAHKKLPCVKYWQHDK